MPQGCRECRAAAKRQCELGSGTLPSADLCAMVSKMKTLFVLLLAMVPWAAALEGTVWYDSKGEVAVVEGAASQPIPEPFVPGWRKRELARQDRQGSYRSSIYDDWHSRGSYGYRTGSRSYGGWGYCRPIRRSHYSGSYRTTSGRFSACFSSGFSGGARIGVLIR